MTKITFDRSGGIVSRAFHYSVDLDSLSSDAAKKNLERLIEEAHFFEIPENLLASSTPDEFQYRITIANEHATHTVRASDTTMPRSLVPLVKELTMLKMLE